MPFLDELKRRNVLRVGAAYVVGAWLLIQVAETIFPLFGFDETPARIVVVLAAIGLVPVLVLAWAFEITPEGLMREKDVDHARPTVVRSNRRLDRAIMVVLALALGWFAFDRFVLAPTREAAVAEEAREAGRAEARTDAYGDLSIAVLPFADMSPEGDQEYLSAGIAEELLNLLARVPELRVISRTSAFAFKDQALEVPEIARRLKVGHVLEGSVRKAGQRVRITAQLIEARSDTHLWSQTWERDLTDVFAIQDEIAGAVAESLQAELLSPRAEPVGPLAAGELAAYERVLRGRYLLNQADPGAYRQAVGYFEEAVELAPDYAPAHAGLAKVLRQLVAIGELDPATTAPRVEAALDRALELDPEDPDALTTRGMLIARGGAGFDEAREYWRRAIAVNPNDADAWRWLGWSYQNVDSVRYLEYIQKGYRVAPTNVMVNINLVWALCRFGRYDEALAVLRDLHALDPDRPLAFALAGDVYYGSRQLDQALRSYYRAYRMAPDVVSSEIANLVWMLMDSLHPYPAELAMEWVERQLANNANNGHSWFQQIVITQVLGRQEAALGLIEDLADHHPEWPLVLARSYLLVADDAVSSRRWWVHLLDSGSDIRYWDAYRVVDYALVLQRTGDADRAAELIDATLARMEQQMAAGVKSEGNWDLVFYAAMLHALRGETRPALAHLQEDARNGGLSCVACLRWWPHFQGLRDDPEFQALIADQEAFDAGWLQRLSGEGLLLNPEQARHFDDPEFDPFEPAAALETPGSE